MRWLDLTLPTGKPERRRPTAYGHMIAAFGAPPSTTDRSVAWQRRQGGEVCTSLRRFVSRLSKIELSEGSHPTHHLIPAGAGLRSRTTQR